MIENYSPFNSELNKYSFISQVLSSFAIFGIIVLFNFTTFELLVKF